MLKLLDQVIEKVLDSGWNAASSPAKPGFYFDMPDDDWAKKADAGTDVKLDIYLYEVTENRNFRRSEWDVIEQGDHSFVRSHPPVYFDCHYLLSAWSPGKASDSFSPVQDEHEVLSEAMRVVLRSPEVIPGALGFTDGGPVFLQSPVYLGLAPPEAPRVLNDFWSTMKQPWRVAVQLVATAPIDLLQDSEPAPMVTTFIRRYVPVGSGDVEEQIQIGGLVIRDDDGTPISGVTVQRLNASGSSIEEVVTDAQGRYSFAGLHRGDHWLHVEAPGMMTMDRHLTIPDGPSGDYVFRMRS